MHNSENSSAPVLLSHRIFSDDPIDFGDDASDSGKEKTHGGSIFDHIIEDQGANMEKTPEVTIPVKATKRTHAPWKNMGTAPKNINLEVR